MNALEAVLASDRFVMAPQMSAFLRYVVEQSAQGNRQRIKAYTVAVEALGKPDSFDPQNDPVVRVLAGRLRTSLNAFNESHPDQELIIQMNPGTYVPEFVVPSEEDDPDHLDATVSEEDDELYMTAANSIISGAELSAESQPTELGIDVILEEHSASPAKELSEDAGSTLTSDHANATADHAELSPGHGRRAASRGATTQRTGSPGLLSGLMQRHPSRVLITGMVVAFLIGLFLPSMDVTQTPAPGAAMPTLTAEGTPRIVRQRPETLSLFIEQGSSGQPVLGQLYSTFSSALAGTESIQLYRILRWTGHERYWPEDYLLSLELVPAGKSTRVNVQLLEAQSGRVSHMQVLTLSDQVMEEGLTPSDLQKVAEHTRFLVGDNGPLRKDYLSKLDR